MKFSIQREAILQPLSQVVGVVERRQTLPVLANFLLVAGDGTLSVTGTDMEVELIAKISADISQPGEVTVPARKLLDICKALPDGANITFVQEGSQVLLRAGRSRYTLSTLPASEEGDLKNILDKTSFAMANQDVRYYLNGLLLDFNGNVLRAIATDGHRLAICDTDRGSALAEDRQFIVPRKGVLELARMLSDGEDEVSIGIGKNHVRLVKDGTTFTSKLIDGRFPDYQAVIPVGADKNVSVNRAEFINALQRAAILSNEKYRGVKLEVAENSMKIIAHNPQHEEAVEELAVEQNFDQVSIGFNVTYLLDALGALDEETVQLQLRDSNSSCLVTDPGNEHNRHVVMPLKL
jgi:DNA polymerase-3 subunit beta